MEDKTNNFKDFCTIDKSNFDEIFHDFFEDYFLNHTDFYLDDELKSNLDYSKIRIKKVILRNGKDYSGFVNKLMNFILDYTDLRTSKYNRTIEDAKKIFMSYINKYGVEIEDVNSDTIYNYNNGKKQIKGSKILERFHSDIGEFILFFLKESIHNYPLFISKIRSRQNNNLPVFGSDGLHAGYNEDGFFLTFGESKLTKSFENGLNQSFNSIEGFINYSSQDGKKGVFDEIFYIKNIEENFSRIDDEKFNNFLTDKLTPFKNKGDEENIPYEIVVFLGYKCDDYNSIKNGIENPDVEYYRNEFASNNKDEYYLKSIYSKVESLLRKFGGNEDLKNIKISFFLLPLLDENELVKELLINLKTDDKTNNG